MMMRRIKKIKQIEYAQNKSIRARKAKKWNQLSAMSSVLITSEFYINNNKFLF